MNLIEGIQQELKRNRELLKAYHDIGQAGIFGATMISHEITAAERAITNGDTVKMLACYKRLQETA